MTQDKRGQAMDAEIRANAVGVLDYLLKLQLTPARWERLAGIVELAIAAEAAADLDGLREAVAELELAGPVRIIRIGGTPVIPPPQPIRERVGILLVELQKAEAETAADKDKR